MPKKYHIQTKATPLNLNPIFKFRIERGNNCINCGRCSKVCIYEAHKRGKEDPRKMAEPNTVVCRNCFRCIQECPRGALEKSIDKDFLKVGGRFWKPDMFITLWKQSEDGAVPVTGAGYRGPFTGPGFDSMWTDMSEIVRPTRDGIHGREYINTSVDLGRKLNHLTFGEAGELLSKVPDMVNVSIPIIFDVPVEHMTANIRAALVKATPQLNTFVVLPAESITPDFEAYIEHIIPSVAPQDVDRYEALVKRARIVELEYRDSLEENLSALQDKVKQIGKALVAIRVPATKAVSDIALKLAVAGVEIIHIVADYCGREVGGTDAQPRLLKDIIRDVHLKLVENGIRDEVTIIASGGIAMAEHVPKSMICGADLTAIGLPPLIALGARLYEEPEMMLIPADGVEKLPVKTVRQRIINLMGAWHSQLLEVMGAMGIREARRLRGETGRAIFFEEIDRETFGQLFNKRETTS